MTVRSLCIAASLFLTPIAVVAVLHHEALQEKIAIDASQVRGKVLFFTAPNR